MLVTSPLKMGKHIYFQVGFDGQNCQTLHFHFEKPDKLHHNLDIVRNLIYAIESNQDKKKDLLVDSRGNIRIGNYCVIGCDLSGAGFKLSNYLKE